MKHLILALSIFGLISAAEANTHTKIQTGKGRVIQTSGSFTTLGKTAQVDRYRVDFDGLLTNQEVYEIRVGRILFRAEYFSHETDGCGSAYYNGMGFYHVEGTRMMARPAYVQIVDHQGRRCRDRVAAPWVINISAQSSETGPSTGALEIYAYPKNVQVYALEAAQAVMEIDLSTGSLRTTETNALLEQATRITPEQKGRYVLTLSGHEYLLNVEEIEDAGCGSKRLSGFVSSGAIGMLPTKFYVVDHRTRLCLDYRPYLWEMELRQYDSRMNRVIGTLVLQGNPSEIRR